MQNLDRFKFRMWDGEKMHYNAENTYDYGCMGDNNIPASYFGELMEWKNIVLMQCTGLKDKNGKLIFENDIVKFIKGNELVIRWHGSEYILRQLKVDRRGIYGYSSMGSDMQECEIIGNIYENKDLAKNTI